MENQNKTAIVTEIPNIPADEIEILEMSGYKLEYHPNTQMLRLSLAPKNPKFIDGAPISMITRYNYQLVGIIDYGVMGLIVLFKQ